MVESGQFHSVGDGTLVGPGAGGFYFGTGSGYKNKK